MRNLELKARCHDLALAARAAEALGAKARGALVQTDTYFHVPRGRLKLREIEEQSAERTRRAELIRYERANEEDFRPSDYDIAPVPDAAAMKALLGRALGVRGEVRKRRLLYLWHNVRIHLDDVRDLGTFLEFEAVVGPDADEALSLRRLEELSRAIGVEKRDRIAVSYSDLLGL